MSVTTRMPAPAPPAADPRRLLAGWLETGRPATLAAHLERYGPPPTGRDRLIAAVDAAGLRGRGGAGFPTARKLRAVAAGRNPVVLVNGCEGEPVSDKDHALLTLAPHLVLDGALLAARAVGAAEITVCVHRGDTPESLTEAVARRSGAGIGIQVAEVPARYVSSEESALVSFLNTGDARPTAKPPRPFERGVRGRPTLIDNVETLAHLALIARYGPDWFRGCGTPESPGTALFTVGGAVAKPGVYESALGVPVRRVLDLAGGPRGPVRAVLAGGYAGGWLPLPFGADQPLTHGDLAAVGASLGVGALILLPADACGLHETARILRYLAGESAAQCGPCMFGLPAIAEDFEQLVVGGREAPEAVRRLRRRLGVIPGRGACGHPDGAVRLAASALRAFEPDLRGHLAGRPCRSAGRDRLRPAGRAGGDWR